jgi:hypothetical protein
MMMFHHPLNTTTTTTPSRNYTTTTTKITCAIILFIILPTFFLSTNYPPLHYPINNNVFFLTLPLTNNNNDNITDLQNNIILPPNKQPPQTNNHTTTTITTNVQLLFPSIPTLPLPTQKIHWCLHADPHPSQALTSTLSLLKRIPSKSTLVFMGDSTIHEPFQFISTCLFHQPNPTKHGFNETLVYTVSNNLVQILYLPNYFLHKPYSLVGNRVQAKIPQFLNQYVKPGFNSKLVIWINFGILHTLHRYPVHMEAGDFGGWTNLHHFVMKETQDLIELGQFQQILVSTPHALCSTHFEPERKSWSETYDVEPRLDFKSCQQMIQKEFKVTNGYDDYCEFGAALPNRAEMLAQKFIYTIQNHLYPMMMQHNIRFGWLNSFELTHNQCHLTKDGIHYEPIVPIEAEAVLKWIVGGLKKH